MEAAIAELAGLLRSNGVRVSPAEVADAVRAAAEVGLEERAVLRGALRATLAKRARDVPVFDAVFDAWAGPLRGAGPRGPGLLEELAALERLDSDDLAEVAGALADLSEGLSPLGRAALDADPVGLWRLLAGAAREVGLAGVAAPGNTAFLSRRLLAAAGAAAARGELARLEAALRARGLDPSKLRLVSARAAAALARVEDAARRLAEAAAGARSVAREGRIVPGALLAPGERARAEAAVRRLAARLRARLVRRERSGRRGALSVRRTLRRNLGLGGAPARLVFRSRRRERPDVVVLCDVSDSVRHVTRLMLLFLYTLQACLGRVRTFVFVADVAEVTGRLRAARGPAEAADLAATARAVPLSANSDYGRVLRAFHRRHLASVTRRTTVLVIGDGRTNHHAPEAWVLEELRRRARRVVWICTEERPGWGTGDSEMPLYAARCDRVATAASLEELEAIADELLPRR